jgi:hypothetical protein
VSTFFVLFYRVHPKRAIKMKSEQKERKPSIVPKASKAKTDGQDKNADELTKREREVITTVFKSFETGLREATILPRVGSSRHQWSVCL